MKKLICNILLLLLLSTGVAEAAINIVPNGGTGVGTITGIVKGNGTSPFSAAVANTDYQSPISLTTTGTSGAATFNGTTLNIPQYAGTTYTAGTGLQLIGSQFSIDSTVATLTGVQTLTNKTLTSPTITGGTLTTSSVNGVTLTTGGSATAYLNGAGAYTTPTGTVPSIGGTLTSATAGSVLFAGSAVFAQDNDNFFWDDTNNRLGIGTATPSSKLQIGADIAGFAITKTISAKDSVTTDFANLAHFDSSVNTARTALLVTNSASGDWVNNLVQIVTHGTAYPYNFYLTNIPGKTTDARYTMLYSQGTDQVGMGIFTYGNVPLYLGANNTAVLTVFNGLIAPTVSDTTALGSTSLQFSDLFLAEGGVINWDNGDATLTQTGNIVALVGATFSLDNKISTYNNIATTGWGVPAIYGTGRSTAQTAAVASVATYTVGASDGSFLVSANVLVTTATLHSFTATVTYTDEGNTSRTVTMQFSTIAGAFVTAMTNAQGTVPYEGVPLHIRAKASTAITIATTGTFTTVVYNVEGSIMQIN